MENAGTALYWFTDPLSVDLNRVKGKFSLLYKSNFAVYCKAVSDVGSVDSDSLMELRSFLNHLSINFIEMHDPCEHIIPSLARVLQVNKVVLVDPDNCGCEPSRLEEVRFRLQMHSIDFDLGIPSLLEF